MSKKKNLVFEIHLTNKWLYSLIVLFALLFFSVIVYAYVTDVPDPGHGGNSVLIDFGGAIGEKSLQQAIDAGNLRVPTNECTLCKTSCGGSWPNLQGRFTIDDDAVANPVEMRDVSCAGSIIDRRLVAVYVALCCK